MDKFYTIILLSYIFALTSLGFYSQQINLIHFNNSVNYISDLGASLLNNTTVVLDFNNSYIL